MLNADQLGLVLDWSILATVIFMDSPGFLEMMSRYVDSQPANGENDS